MGLNSNTQPKIKNVLFHKMKKMYTVCATLCGSLCGGLVKIKVIGQATILIFVSNNAATQAVTPQIPYSTFNQQHNRRKKIVCNSFHHLHKLLSIL